MHDFGAKFQGRDISKGRFYEYVAYIRSIAERLGFEIKQENLRIPSTKNIALIGHRGTQRTPMCECAQTAN